MTETARLEERCRVVCDEMETELEDEQAKVKAAVEKLVRAGTFYFPLLLKLMYRICI